MATANSSDVDAYGFERGEDFDFKTYEEFMNSYIEVLSRRAGRWSKMLGTNADKINKSRKAKRFCRKGIPAQYRTQAWMNLSGAGLRQSQNIGLYQKLLDGPKEQRVIESIDLDLHRTYPDNVYFKDDARQSKRESLRNVLIAFAHHNKAIGYCQGLNYITAMMLIVMKDEEKAFFLLDTLINRILPDYYTKEMLGLKVDQEVLGQLVKIKAPSVYQHIQKEDMDWSIPTTKWFICIYLEVLPIETVLRIWDSLFYEGSKIIFRVALTLVLSASEQILRASNFPSILEAFKKSVQDSAALDCHSFMQRIFKEPGSLPMAQINRLRQTSREKITQEA